MDPYLLIVGGIESLGLLSIWRRTPVRRGRASAAAVLLRRRRHDLGDAEVQVVCSVSLCCKKREVRQFQCKADRCLNSLCRLIASIQTGGTRDYGAEC